MCWLTKVTDCEEGPRCSEFRVQTPSPQATGPHFGFNTHTKDITESRLQQEPSRLPSLAPPGGWRWNLGGPGAEGSGTGCACHKEKQPDSRVSGSSLPKKIQREEGPTAEQLEVNWEGETGPDDRGPS